MTELVGIAGSLRAGSFNRSLLEAAARLAPQGVSLRIASIDEVPLYNADVERDSGVPASVRRLQDRIAAADGLILASPEYNSSIPGVLKNVMDWLSRPPDQIGRVFRDRPVAVIGATPGGLGTVLSQTAWLPVLKALGTRQWSGDRLSVSRAGELVDADGRIKDARLEDRIKDFMRGFAAFAAARE
ncbi:MAG: NADPH-dependent FMN reductase [Gammaproteobacteria bacterium]|jgi:NAD(P)H-dependent FMN reductase